MNVVITQTRHGASIVCKNRDRGVLQKEIKTKPTQETPPKEVSQCVSFRTHTVLLFVCLSFLSDTNCVLWLDDCCPCILPGTDWFLRQYAQIQGVGNPRHGVWNNYIYSPSQSSTLQFPFSMFFSVCVYKPTMPLMSLTVLSWSLNPSEPTQKLFLGLIHRAYFLITSLAFDRRILVYVGYGTWRKHSPSNRSAVQNLQGWGLRRTE